MQRLITAGLTTLFFIIAGCAAFTPYESDFTCPKTFNGKCVSTTTAYKESLVGRGKNGSEGGHAGDSTNKELTADEGNPTTKDPEHTYFNALIEKLTGLLKEPKAPVIAPPQVLRVLVLPYQGENSELYMPRYIYLIIDDPKWVLGNQLSDRGSGKNKKQTDKSSFPLR